MAQVHVVFPKQGDPVAAYDYVPALWEEIVNWNFQCNNDDVKYVWIGFDDSVAKYFPKGNGTEPDTWCLKELSKRDTGSVERKARAKTQMWGQCPDYSGASPVPPRHQKYHIYGLSAPWENAEIPDKRGYRGAKPEIVVCKLDPEIDPIDPT